jgi:predicted transcriptional regulator
MDSENVNQKKNHTSSFTNTEQTFIELASSQRLSILFKLGVHNAKISNLAKDLNVTIQEVHRNINRLVDAGLIHKGAEGIFSLTTFGSTIIKQISTFYFLSRNKEYFSDHTLGEI